MQTLHRFPERPDPLLTIVVPCFEEEETIPEFHQRITRVVKRLSVSCEILYVDDGSKDRTADILRHYQDGSSVRYLSLSRNFRQRGCTERRDRPCPWQCADLH